MSENSKITGSCLCGKSRYSIETEASTLPLTAFVCHCNRCRHITGVLGLTVAFLPKGTKPASDVLNLLKPYESSPGFSRYSCPQCGACVFAHHDGSEVWLVGTGTLDKIDTIVDFKAQIFIPDTVDGGLSSWLHKIGDKQPKRFEKSFGSTELSQPLECPTLPPASDRVHAHCDCKGVSFYISPPGAHSADSNTNSGLAHRVDDQPQDQTWWLSADGKKYVANNCMCDSCRLVSGSEFQQWMYVPTIDISLSSDGKTPFSTEFGTLKRYESSKRAVRYFCGTCSATVFFQGHERPGIINVSIGLLNAKEGALARSLLEWETGQDVFREDGIKRCRGLVDGLEAGLKARGEKQ